MGSPIIRLAVAVRLLVAHYVMLLGRAAPAVALSRSSSSRHGCSPRWRCSPLPPRARMVAAIYRAVYGALLDNAKRYYVFDALAMRERAFQIGSGPEHREIRVAPADREQGRKVIRDTVGAISAFYRYPTSPGSAP